MTGIEHGNVCVKTQGRDAGKLCVVMKTEKNFAEVLSLGRKKKRKVNVLHLKPTGQKLEAKGEETLRKELAALGQKIA